MSVATERLALQCVHSTGLRERLQAQALCVVLDLSFDRGQAFRAAWRLWREVRREPSSAPGTRARLAYVAIASAALRRRWPPAVSGLHSRVLENGTLHLHFVVGELHEWLPQLALRADCIWGDVTRALEAQALEPQRLAKGLARLAAPDASVRLLGLQPQHVLAMRAVGFVEGPGTVTLPGYLARFAPLFVPRQPRSGLGSVGGQTPRIQQHAPVLIIGAGLAGCATAAALAQLGRASLLLDRQTGSAQEASGNVAGLVHPIVHSTDGLYSRYHRAAALYAKQAIRPALHKNRTDCMPGARRMDSVGASGQAGGPLPEEVAGNLEGLLRLEPRLSLGDMRAILAQQNLPAAWVQALSADEASDRAGVRLAHPAWWYAEGGWVSPGQWVRYCLQLAGPLVHSRFGCRVDRLERRGSEWLAFDAADTVLAVSDTVVLANTYDATRLWPQAQWPLRLQRGQVSQLPATVCSSLGLARPKIPVVGEGYAVPLADGSLLIGATHQWDDPDAALRERDHRANLALLPQLLGAGGGDPWQGIDLADVTGRVGWRCVSPDRLPLAGRVADALALHGRRHDNVRQVPRQPGLWVLSALGSRGIASTALCGALVAAGIQGAPAPISRELIDALDPARFAVRRDRQQQQ